MSMFKKATKEKLKLRLGVQGPSGSGKTTGALEIATAIGKKIAFIDTERGSSRLYAGKYDFDVLELSDPFEPEKYIEAIEGAVSAGYDVAIIDSMSHEWQWCLETVTKLGGNSFIAWGKVTPRHDKLIHTILNANIHIIACMRSKTEYILEDKNGKSVPKKAGLASIQREGLDYEFTIVFELNLNHLATCTKDRSTLFMGKDLELTQKVGKDILAWLNDGAVAQVSKLETKKSDNPFDQAQSMNDVKKIWASNKDRQSDVLFIEMKEKAKSLYDAA